MIRIVLVSVFLALLGLNAFAANRSCEWILAGRFLTRGLKEKFAQHPSNARLQAVLLVDVRQSSGYYQSNSCEALVRRAFAAFGVKAELEGIARNGFQFVRVEGPKGGLLKAIFDIQAVPVAWAGLIVNSHVLEIYAAKSRGETSRIHRDAPDDSIETSEGEAPATTAKPEDMNPSREFDAASVVDRDFVDELTREESHELHGDWDTGRPDLLH